MNLELVNEFLKKYWKDWNLYEVKKDSQGFYRMILLHKEDNDYSINITIYEDSIHTKIIS